MLTNKLFGFEQDSRNMKVAILGDYAPGYICPMMRGLDRMLKELKCETVLLSNGIRMLSASPGIKGVIKSCLLRPYLSLLSQCDAIVVVQHLRDAFRTSLKIDTLRLVFPAKPIILYDLVYLPTVGLWGPWLEPSKKYIWGKGESAVYGLDRYDWYLSVSVQNRLPMPEGKQPCSEIGIDLDDGTLYPAQNQSFMALVDFEREDFPEERNIQLEALKETGTEYIVLSGSYSIADIRAIYRTCSIYFPAHMESFGLPICELQACGSRILTPYGDWCDAHRLPESDQLPPNFIIYSNNKAKLVQTIKDLKKEANPREAAEQFRKYHRHFMTGNLNALQDSLDQIGRNEISSQSHFNYTEMTGQIPNRPADINPAKKNLPERQ
jgi:hypothetical protein